jgi:hypothetical protein
MQPQKGQPAKVGEKGKRKPHLLGDPDQAITPSISWSGNTVTVWGIPQENSSDPTAVTVDGVATTLNASAPAGRWQGTVAQRTTGNSLTVTYSSTLSYSNNNFPATEYAPRCPKN